MQSVTRSTSRPDGLASLLADLVSEPRLDRVLAKLADHAGAELDGAEVALLLDGPDGPVCETPCPLAPHVQKALERWSASEEGVLEKPVLLSGSSAAAVLDKTGTEAPSLCAAPMHYGERRLGTLVVAIGDGARVLDPGEFSRLEAYAVQGAIALTNARLFEAQEALAKRDPLTGLLNHREFHETVARELSRSRQDGTQLSMILLDLDRFKAINDTAGHGAGDRVLRAVASALGGVCRTEDQAFRVGGDEFAVVLPRSALSGAAAAASRAAAAVEAVSPRVGISYGVAGWPQHGPTKDAVLARADASLYEMKSLRRGRVTVPAPASLSTRSERQRERLAVASRLSTKLAHAQEEEEVARLCVYELHHAFHYYLAVIQRLDPDGVLRVVAGAGPLAEGTSDFLALTQSVTEGVNGRVARTGEAALVPDTRLDPDYLRRDPCKDPGSELSVPVRVHGQVWGVLNLEQIAVHAFADEDLLLADTAAAQVGAALHRCELVRELEHAFLTTLAVLSDAVECKDAYTARHADEVSELATAVARRLGLAGTELRAVRHAALMHDLGKVGVRSEILLKPAGLEAHELEQMEQHTVIGAGMLERIPFFADLAPLVRSSHERWDGNGYPDSLRARSIPLGARVIAASDAFHAMTSDRPYRPAMPRYSAILELRAGAGTQFDPEVVAALLEEVDD
ncbi:MAG: diguanylate cyclase [Solirubrobacteraceae bacterium]